MLFQDLDRNGGNHRSFSHLCRNKGPILWFVFLIIVNGCVAQSDDVANQAEIAVLPDHAGSAMGRVSVLSSSATETDLSAQSSHFAVKKINKALLDSKENVGGEEGEEHAIISVKRPEPKDLMGIGLDKLPQTLGQPALVRRDGPSAVWQYEAENCVLDVFLYRTKPIIPLQVIHLETRNKTGQPVDTKECLQEIGIKRVSG